MRSRSLAASVLCALAAAAPAGAAPLHGTYRVALTVRALVHVGASAREAGWDAGTWTLTLAGGRWTLRQNDGRYGNAVDRGTVDAGGAFTLRSADGFVHNEFVGTFRRQSTALRLRFAAVVRPRNRDIAQILTAQPWTRVR